MRFNAALARRVALILGLSLPAFNTALADGRAVLPPRWMIEAYLSGALVKPSRDDIARAIIPGLGMAPAFLGGGKLSYTDAIAAITNKSIYVRGDSYGGSNGTQVSSSNWTNEGSVGGAFTSAASGIVWETNSQNGMPGVKNPVSGGALTRAVDYNTLHGTNGAMTLFVVEKRSGSQSTSGVFLGDQNFFTGHRFNTRTIEYYDGLVSFTQSTSLSYTDDVPHVIGIRVNTSGNLRVNFNGASVYSDATSRSAPTSSAANLLLFRNNNTSNNYFYECICTADVLSDALIDNIVIALKEKWGIT